MLCHLDSCIPVQNTNPVHTVYGNPLKTVVRVKTLAFSAYTRECGIAMVDDGERDKWQTPFDENPGHAGQGAHLTLGEVGDLGVPVVESQTGLPGVRRLVL